MTDCQQNEPCPINLQVPNTKKGKNKTIWKNMNKLQDCNSDEDCYNLPLRIVFPRVNKAGETFVYRLPSAYPEPKPVWSVSAGIGRPQYFQFDSSALLRKKNTGRVKLLFKKSDMDANFSDPSKIVVAFYNGKNWKNTFLPFSVVTQGQNEFYQVLFPKKRRLIGMVAFFEE